MAVYDILNKIQVKSPDVITRANIGKSTIHPRIKGYFYVIMELPDAIFTTEERKHAQKWLSATATNFTPHSKTLNMIDLNAMGGVQHSYVTGQTFTRDISISYYEYQGGPIWRIHKKWMDILFDPYTGLSALSDYIPANYKGTLIVVKTRPLGAKGRIDNGFSDFNENMIENVWVYPGVVPTDDQTTALDDDIAGQAETLLTYTYRFDGYPLTDDYKPDLKNTIAQFLSKFAADNKSSVGTDDLISNLLNAVELPG